jgi:hypothetical protein
MAAVSRLRFLGLLDQPKHTTEHTNTKVHNTYDRTRSLIVSPNKQILSGIHALRAHKVHSCNCHRCHTLSLTSAVTD